MRSAALIYNPKSGRQVSTRRLPKILDRLRRGGFEVDPRPTRGPGDATRLAEAAAAEGLEVVFALGGDGTVREVAKGLLGTPAALAPLPGGTTNVVVRALGIPRHPVRAAETLVRGSIFEMDIGRLAGEPFLMLASGGLDAAVMARQNSTAKRFFGKAAVAWVVLREWLKYQLPTVTVEAAGQRSEVEYFALCNLPLYAGDFRLAPDADPTDRRLDLLRFHGRGRWATAGFLIDMALGRHPRRKDVEIDPVTEVTLDGKEPILLQIDGDVLTVDPPVTLDLAPERLRVLGPA